ncbi:cytochrome P450 4C1-like [Chrysoperla carnea]|uniref:cytochrome P450 4C1-like n=1 Tax=Chrysoperla carnea TaxID=189513 RepID=UPI001D07599D|nr:cytochrome P450 4C1-like [Chrysoperla carnea]
MLVSLDFNFISMPIIFTISVAVSFLICVYFSNFIRMCYYVSKIRGPLAYPVIGNGLSLKGSHEELTNFIFKTANDYAPITRLWMGPIPLLFTVEPKIVQELLTSSSALEKAWFMKLIVKALVRKSLVISEVPQWKRTRTLMMKGFTLSLLKLYFKIFEDKIDILTGILDKLELNKENTFDMYGSYLSKVAVDSICATSIGVDMNVLQTETSYFDAMGRSLNIMMKRGYNPLKYPDVFYRLTKDYKKLMEYRDMMWSFTRKVILEKRNKDKDPVNNKLINSECLENIEYKKLSLLDIMLEFKKCNPDFTDDQLQDEINFLIIAGFDGIAKTVSMASLLLALNKDIQTKVCEELFQVLRETNRTKINFEDLAKLKFMEQVIKETLRLFPGVPLILREVSKDILIENYTIPKGANIAIPIFSLHRNEVYWENSLKFDPERFTADNIQKQHPYAFIPFSAGPRSCLGYRYAWVFMKLALAKLLSRYEFHTNIKDISEIRFKLEISMSVIGGHQVRITPRQRRF